MWYPWTILFSKIYHMLGLSGTLPYAVFVYLCICVFVFLYLRVWHMWISFLIPLNNPLLKNIPYVGSFWHCGLCCICVFVYLYLCLTHGNISFHILDQSSFQKYTTCWVFLAIRHMLYLCICVFCICIFVFLRLAHGNSISNVLEQSCFQKYTTCWVFLALCNMLYLCICVFVFVYLSTRHSVISVLIS